MQLFEINKILNVEPLFL